MPTPKSPYHRLALAPALALAALLPLASAAQAGEAAEPIVVTSPEKMKAWQKDTTRSLNRALEREGRRGGGSPSSGIVQLTFDLDEDGRPGNIEVRSNTANWTAANDARSAVRRLGDIGDVPVKNVQGARFLANVIFANDPVEHRDLAQELARSESARMAAAGSGSDLIVLGG